MFRGRCSSVTSLTVYQMICIFWCILIICVKGNQKDKLINYVDLYSDSSVKDVPVRNKYSMVIARRSREITVKLLTHGLSLLSNILSAFLPHALCDILKVLFYGNSMKPTMVSNRWVLAKRRDPILWESASPKGTLRKMAKPWLLWRLKKKFKFAETIPEKCWSFLYGMTLVYRSYANHTSFGDGNAMFL